MPSSTPARRAYAARLPAEQRQQQLLDAALAISAREGLRSVTMERVAVEAGVTKPVVYGQFANAESLLDALVEREQLRAWDQVVEALPQEEDFDDPLEVAAVGVRAYLSSVEEHTATWRLMIESDQLPECARDTYARARREVVRTIARLIESVASDRPAGHIDPELLAEVVVTNAERAARLMLDAPEVYTRDRLLVFSRELYRSIWLG